MNQIKVEEWQKRIPKLPCINCGTIIIAEELSRERLLDPVDFWANGYRKMTYVRGQTYKWELKGHCPKCRSTISYNIEAYRPIDKII